MGDNSKQMSIPLLTLSIISPKEFEKLQEFQKTKEDSVKFRTSKIESSTNENLNDIVPLSLIEPQKIIDDSSNYTINTDMQFTMNSENNLVLEYEIVREDITKDWANCESKFSGRVEIVKDEKTKEITFRNEFTSSETEAINRKVVRKNVKSDSFESRLANVYFGKTSKSQNVKNATRLILEEFEKLYQMQYHSCLKK